MNESWIIHPPAFLWSKCRGIAHSVICVWLHQVADGPCHRHQLRQQVSVSCVAPQLTWLQWHCSCFCNTRLTSPTRPLMALHCSPHRNTGECALEAKAEQFWRASAVASIKLYPFVRSKVVFFMLFCAFCCKACHHWKINGLYGYKNTSIKIYGYSLQNTFFYIPQNADSENDFMHQIPK